MSLRCAYLFYAAGGFRPLLRSSGDPRLLERLIANLIDNAIQHNIAGGDLEITTATRDRHAFLTITNTGPAVSPDQIEQAAPTPGAVMSNRAL